MKVFRILSVSLFATWTGHLSAAELYIWTDPSGVEHVSALKPKGNFQYKTVASTPRQVSPAIQRAKLVPPPVKKRVLPKKNIVTAGVSPNTMRDVIIGSWSHRYEGGGSKLIYKADGRFTYRNKNKRAQFTHKGNWRIYKRHNRWYVNHQGSYLTKTKHGKTFNGKINDTYIIKKLSGKNLVLLEAKNQRHISDPGYDLNYFR